MTPAPLTERQRRVLALLVRGYIERGEPVSSLWLAEQSGIGVSSATVRHILASLEESGHVHQPHTSAGRVPTDLGYRCYVDLLLLGRRPARPTPGVEARLRRAGTLDGVLDDVSHEVSRASHHVGFALVPANDATVLRSVDFVALDERRVLVVLVASGQQVWHKAVTLEEAVAPTDLAQAANYLNGEFAGHRLADIRAALVSRMRADRALYDRLAARALQLASATLGDVAPEAQLVVHGASSLVEDASGDAGIPLPTLRTVLGMIEEKHRLVRLLTEYIEGPGLTVVIGAEHTVPDLRDFSLVAMTSVSGGQVATVGVLGPRRMRYSRAITAVETASRAVGRVLDDRRH